MSPCRWPLTPRCMLIIYCIFRGSTRCSRTRSGGSSRRNEPQKPPLTALQTRTKLSPRRLRQKVQGWTYVDCPHTPVTTSPNRTDNSSDRPRISSAKTLLIVCTRCSGSPDVYTVFVYTWSHLYIAMASFLLACRPTFNAAWAWRGVMRFH